MVEAWPHVQLFHGGWGSVCHIGRQLYQKRKKKSKTFDFFWFWAPVTEEERKRQRSKRRINAEERRKKEILEKRMS